MGYYTHYGFILKFRSTDNTILKIESINLGENMSSHLDITPLVNNGDNYSPLVNNGDNDCRYSFSYEEKRGCSGYGACISMVRAIIKLNPDVIIDGSIGYSTNEEDHAAIFSESMRTELVVHNSKILEVIKFDQEIVIDNKRYALLGEITIDDENKVDDGEDSGSDEYDAVFE